MDERRRRLERAVAQGDVQAAEALLLVVSRSGEWFLPRGVRTTEGYSHSLNSERAHWVRLLGWLKWPGAPEFQRTISAQVPRRRVIHPTTEWAPPAHLEMAQPMDELGTVRPFRSLGPKISDGIGASVMWSLAQAAAAQCVQFVNDPRFQDRAGVRYPTITMDSFTEALGVTIEAIRFREAMYSGEMLSVEESTAVRNVEREIEERIRLLVGAPPYAIVEDVRRRLGETGRFYIRLTPRLARFSCARQAVTRFFSTFGRHRYDQPEIHGASIFWAVQAAGWACEELRDPEQELETRFKTGWSDTYGVSPGRGCMVRANREIKGAMLGPALLAIAGEVSKPIQITEER